LRILFLPAALALIFLQGLPLPADDAKSTPLPDVAQKAASQSTLIETGSTPFHIKVTVTDPLNPDSDYSATMEEFWVSSQKWRRTIDSPDFSQITIVNGGKVSEQDTGDYFPLWLRDIVTAVLAPLPMIDGMKDWKAELPALSGDASRISCSRLKSKFGASAAPIELTFSFCFEGSRGLVDSVTTPQFTAQFKNYISFKYKFVAREIWETRDPRLKIRAIVTELSDISNPDEGLFAVQPIGGAGTGQLQTIDVTEASLRGLSIITPDILWPNVTSGTTSGTIATYVSVDTSGYVREVWILSSDNPSLNDALRKQIMKWQFNPAVVNGSRLQVESILTFPFKTKLIK
jgi:hypothetical protein